MIVPIAILVTAAAWFLYQLRWAFNAQLNRIPGPLIARFTRFYRLSMVIRGKAPEEYRAAHEKYGPVVRLGPRHVSFSDPAAIPVIYGVGSKFYKVSQTDYGQRP
jgi:hypothetical protein